MDCLQDYWPEPIVRVQSLSDSGITVIPDRYVKPPTQRPSPDSVADGTGSSLRIPVIDLGGLADGVVECRATMQAISEACKEWGFFQVVNHGVSPDLLRKAREVWKQFFHLPMDEKQIYSNSPKTYEGYGSRLGVEKGAVLDWGDYYFLNFLPDSIKNCDKWPSNPDSCREITEEFGRELAKLCGVLMKVLSISLGLDVGFLQEAFGGDEAGATMRANYYPKCPQPELALGLSAHSDPGGLTLLLADERVKGLQVRKGDAWVTVQPVPDAFIVNIGDQIQVLSNAIYTSVEHRVATNSIEERFSIAFFYNPKGDLLLRPAQELVGPDRAPLYQPMTYNQYRTHIRKKGPSGKSQVEALKAM